MIWSILPMTSGGYPVFEQRKESCHDVYLRRVESVLQTFPDACILFLRRDRQATIGSFLTWIAKNGRGGIHEQPNT